MEGDGGTTFDNGMNFGELQPDGRYKVEFLTGTKEFKPPTYRLTTKIIPGRWWERNRREHTLTCVETGVVLSGMDDEGLAFARQHLTIL